MHLPFSDKRQVEEAARGLLLRGEDNLSRHYRKTNRAITDASLETGPAYHTRRQDGVFYPTTDTYNNTYIIIEMGSLLYKTKLPFKYCIALAPLPARRQTCSNRNYAY
jgi:hypothetical protein